MGKIRSIGFWGWAPKGGSSPRLEERLDNDDDNNDDNNDDDNDKPFRKLRG